MMRRRIVVAVVGFVSLFGLPALLCAQEFPTKAISVFIGYGAGGSTDLSGRALCAEAAKTLKQSIVCTNQPGANGTLVLGRAKGDKPDGYTLYCVPTAAFTATPHLQPVPYDPLKDFTYIMQYAVYQYGIVVRSDSPWKTIEEFIDYAKKNPNKIKYVTAGMGSGGHRAMTYLGEKYGVKWNHVPVKSGMECVTTLLGGHVDAISNSTEWKEQVKSGKFRILLVTSAHRLKSFPDVPTLKDKGHSFVVYSGLSFVGPAGIPAPIVEKIQNALAQGMSSKPFLDVLDNFEMPPAYLDSATFSKVIPTDFKETGEQFKKIGLGKK
jgi:tripartite-type tricarboxylate transporter receptor subunit TctC